MREAAVRIVHDDGHVSWRTGDVESLLRCPFCGEAFVPRVHGQYTCGSEPCTKKRRNRSKLTNARQRQRARDRNRRWAVANRAVKSVSPWLRGEPCHGPHLPGGGVELHVSPPPRWPVEHRNIRQLHGMMTVLTAEPHRRWPVFALTPWPAGIGWGAYIFDEEVALRVAGKTFGAALYDRPVTVRFGPLVRVRAPTVGKRGRQRVRVDTITPIVIQSTGRTHAHIVPTAASLLAALTLEFPERMGLDGFDRSLATLELVDYHAEKAAVQIGAKYGTVVGWTGWAVLEVNAVTRWLIECAARVGLGGRTAFGFGRIRVSDG